MAKELTHTGRAIARWYRSCPDSAEACSLGVCNAATPVSFSPSEPPSLPMARKGQGSRSKFWMCRLLVSGGRGRGRGRPWPPITVQLPYRTVYSFQPTRTLLADVTQFQKLQDTLITT